MENDDRIPEKTYIELCELMGKEKAEEYIKKVNYNLLELQMKIFLLTMGNSIKNHPILFIIIGIVIIIVILNKFFWWF
ncbi:MAG: hypothetical protein LBQ22_12535 [Bacteroidales bacterium]|jgi:hypothetical protein|nr:hypothetical protein [Bacteroidales bacterium]